MKSIALKTNNSQIIEYLQNELMALDLDDIIFSTKKYKHYKNIIIHYKGDNKSLFIEKISSILSFLVIYEFEDTFLKNIIYKNYFYFTNAERKLILNNSFDVMIENNSYLKNKYNTLYKTFYSYLALNSRVFLTGFINFRLHEYVKILSDIVDDAVNTFIIEKEYQEFVSLLKLYINSQKCETEELHIIYSKKFTILLDKDKNIIKNTTDNFNAKFLSDITFSTNDHTLNTILNTLPQKIYVHLIDNTIDEFIKTLSLIFEKRLIICNNCNLCNLYKNNTSNINNSIKKN